MKMLLTHHITINNLHYIPYNGKLFVVENFN